MGVVCVPHWAGRGFEGRLCGTPSLLTPQAGGALGMSLGHWGLGDWDAGVNRVAGSVGATEEVAPLEQGEQGGCRAVVSGWGGAQHPRLPSLGCSAQAPQSCHATFSAQPR